VVAKLKVSLQELRDEKEKATRKEDSSQAALVKQKIQDIEKEIEKLLNTSVENAPEMLELTMVFNESEATTLKSLAIAECLLKRTNDVSPPSFSFSRSLRLTPTSFWSRSPSLRTRSCAVS